MSRLDADDVAVERLVAGEWDHRRRPRQDDLVAAVLQLLAGDFTCEQIAARLDVHPRQVNRWKHQVASGLDLVLDGRGKPRRTAAAS